MKSGISDETAHAMSLDIDSGAMEALEDELASINSVRSVKKPLQLLVEDLSNKMFKNFITCAFVFIVVSICMYLVIWSLFFRVPDINNVHILDFEIQEKQLEIGNLKTRLGSMDSLEIDHQIEVEHIRIFNGYDHLAIWIDSVSVLANDLKLAMSFTIGNSHESEISQTLEVPITFTFLPLSKSDVSVFVASMKLIRKLLSDHWHLDIISTKARGNRSGLSSLQTTMQVWVSEKEGFRLNETTEPGQVEQLRRGVDDEFVQ